MAEISIFLAFIAGIVSFLAPCVLPLIPGFLAYLAGTSLEEAKIKRKEVFINSLLFVLGFSIVFSLLGVLLNTILESVSYDIQNWLARIGGAIIIFFGLYLAGLIKIPLLSREFKFSAEGKVKSKYLTSLLFGFAFAVGWKCFRACSNPARLCIFPITCLLAGAWNSFPAYGIIHSPRIKFDKKAHKPAKIHLHNLWNIDDNTGNTGIHAEP